MRYSGHTLATCSGQEGAYVHCAASEIDRPVVLFVSLEDALRAWCAAQPDLVLLPIKKAEADR